MTAEGALRFFQFGASISHGTDSNSCDFELVSEVKIAPGKRNAAIIITVAPRFEMAISTVRG